MPVNGMSETFAFLHLLRGLAMISRIGDYKLQRFLRHGTMPQLKAFYAVMRLGSVTQAAELLCVAQPTLSGHLRKLSETLDVTLFVAQGKQLKPTEAANVLLETVQQVFSTFELCEQRLAPLRLTLVDERSVRQPSSVVTRCVG